MKKKQIIICMVLIFVLTMSTTIYAVIQDSITVKNNIRMGDINIRLEELEIKNGREIAYENNKEILPGDILSKIPRIHNEGEDCYIRVKLSFGNNNNNIDGISEYDLIGLTKDWIKKGEYFYYTKTLKKNKYTDLFSGISIPKDWGKEHMLQKLSLEIRADAIQAANFTPDFSTMSPWGNQLIQQCVHMRDGISECIRDPIALSLELSKKAQRLIAVPEDFFFNLPVIMPGDKVSDTISLSNTTEEDVELIFSTSLDSPTKSQLQLLETLKLEIQYDNHTIYAGDLVGKGLYEGISLGTFAAGETGKMKFYISADSSMDNRYGLETASVKWIFQANGEKQTESNDSSNSVYHTNSVDNPVKTGDDSPTEILSTVIVVMFLLMVLLLFFILLRKQQDL